MDSTCYQIDNWVRTVMIKWFVPEGSLVCEFYPGDGQDSGKWQRANVDHLTTIDQNELNIEKLIERCVRKKYEHLPLALVSDVSKQKIEWNNSQLLSWYSMEVDNLSVRPDIRNLLTHEGIYDAVSCFSGVDRAFTDITTAENLIYNASKLLKDGGTFFGIIPDSSVLFNRANKQKVEEDGIIKCNGFELILPKGHSVYDVFNSNLQKCPIFLRNPNEPKNIKELFLVHCPTFISLCSKHNLMLLEIQNLQDFYEENRNIHSSTLKKMLGPIKIQIKDIQKFGLFACFSFRKVVS